MSGWDQFLATNDPEALGCLALGAAAAVWLRLRARRARAGKLRPSVMRPMVAIAAVLLVLGALIAFTAAGANGTLIAEPGTETAP